ncbi:hypothetical protein FF38_01000 [Lucilia cuprina]|uniref:Reverse transcriptase domain-containing protein n=1 Tax=Lucilia cuprina TaxID=7375 RepID=A0A0L0BXH2_LUCCU|nr:hypothetical protein FF38_01000 [Lucilia cuprina]
MRNANDYKHSEDFTDSNYRRDIIMLLYVGNKVMARIIAKRISHNVTPSLRQEQAGFRQHKSIIDHINTPRRLSGIHHCVLYIQNYLFKIVLDAIIGEALDNRRVLMCWLDAFLDLFVIGKDDIEDVSQFCYLGSINVGTSEDIDNRLQRVRQAFYIWKSSSLSSTLLFCTVVRER